MLRTIAWISFSAIANSEIIICVDREKESSAICKCQGSDPSALSALFCLWTALRFIVFYEDFMNL